MKQIEKICTGCGRSSLNPISEQYAACCPDNNYVEISNNKQHMKLYTEEEVMKLMLSMKTYIESHNLIFQVKLEQLTPIELPSDEDIDKESSKWRAPSQAFRGGAKWVIEQIKQQENGK